MAFGVDKQALDLFLYFSFKSRHVYSELLICALGSSVCISNQASVGPTHCDLADSSPPGSSVQGASSRQEY